jgi:TatD DNase family protein
MIIDSHAHLDMKDFDKDRDEVVERAQAAGIEAVINPGVDLESSQKSVELTNKYPSVYAAVGVQPEEIDQYFDGDQIKIDIRVELEKLAGNKKIVALGECGLDYKYIREKSSSAKASEDLREKQKDIFRRQLGLAVLLDLPVIIHNREADEDILAEIERYKDTKKLRGVFHCFTGTLGFARKVLALGFLVSLTGIITYPDAQELREVVKKVPLEKIMVETDSPFLSPQPHRGHRNEPSFVVEVVKEIAKIKNLTFGEVTAVTSENARKMFRVG